MKRTASRKPLNLAGLYAKDETAWLEQSSQLIHDHRYEDLDYEHLEEYLWEMAEREKREVRSRLLQLIVHLLKWQYQTKQRARSWQNSILNQREELEDLLSSQSLAKHAEESFPGIYTKAVKRALRETNLEASVFPEDCPYSLEYLLGEEFPS